MGLSRLALAAVALVALVAPRGASDRLAERDGAGALRAQDAESVDNGLMGQMGDGEGAGRLGAGDRSGSTLGSLARLRFGGFGGKLGGAAKKLGGLGGGGGISSIGSKMRSKIGRSSSSKSGGDSGGGDDGGSGCTATDDAPCSGHGSCNEESGLCTCAEGWTGTLCDDSRAASTDIRTDCSKMSNAQLDACYKATHTGSCTAYKLSWQAVCVRQCQAMQGQSCSLDSQMAFCGRAPDCSPMCHALFSKTCNSLLAHEGQNPMTANWAGRTKQWYDQDEPEAALKGVADAEDAAESAANCEGRPWDQCNGECRWTGFSRFDGSCAPAAETGGSWAEVIASGASPDPGTEGAPAGADARFRQIEDYMSDGAQSSSAGPGSPAQRPLPSDRPPSEDNLAIPPDMIA